MPCAMCEMLSHTVLSRVAKEKSGYAIVMKEVMGVESYRECAQRP
jgi:hypothetical protein